MKIATIALHNSQSMFIPVRDHVMHNVTGLLVVFSIDAIPA